MMRRLVRAAPWGRSIAALPPIAIRSSSTATAIRSSSAATATAAATSRAADPSVARGSESGRAPTAPHGGGKLKRSHKRMSSLLLELEESFKQDVLAQEGRYAFDDFQAGDAIEVVAQNPDAQFAGKAKLLKYYGTVLGKGTAGHRLGATFSIRSIIAGVAITHTFPVNAPWLKAVSVIEKAHFKGGKKLMKKARLSKAEAAELRPFMPV